jgi:hypothetical protein
MQEWRDTLGEPQSDDPPTPFANEPRADIRSPTVHPQNTASGTPPEGDHVAKLEATLGILASAMEKKLDTWQDQQVKLNSDLIREVKNAVQGQQAQRPERPPLPPGAPPTALPRSTTDRVPTNIRVIVTPQRMGSLPAPGWLYAVAHGRNTGIFDNWKNVLTSVSEFPSAKYKSFRRRPDAEE